MVEPRRPGFILNDCPCTASVRAILANVSGLGLPRPIRLAGDLRRSMIEDEVRKVDIWTARYRLATVYFPTVETPAGPLDPFFNANRPDDLATAERFAGG